MNSARMKMVSEKQKLGERPVVNGITRIVYAKMLVELPNFGNQATKHSELSQGIFRYDDFGIQNDKIILRGPYELENGSVY